MASDRGLFGRGGGGEDSEGHTRWIMAPLSREYMEKLTPRDMHCKPSIP